MSNADSYEKNGFYDGEHKAISVLTPITGPISKHDPASYATGLAIYKAFSPLLPPPSVPGVYPPPEKAKEFSVRSLGGTIGEGFLRTARWTCGIGGMVGGVGVAFINHAAWVPVVVGCSVGWFAAHKGVTYIAQKREDMAARDTETRIAQAAKTARENEAARIKDSFENERTQKPITVENATTITFEIVSQEEDGRGARSALLTVQNGSNSIPELRVNLAVATFSSNHIKTTFQRGVILSTIAATEKRQVEVFKETDIGCAPGQFIATQITQIQGHFGNGRVLEWSPADEAGAAADQRVPQTPSKRSGLVQLGKAIAKAPGVFLRKNPSDTSDSPDDPPSVRPDSKEGVKKITPQIFTPGS